jgi:hypothetical protein
MDVPDVLPETLPLARRLRASLALAPRASRSSCACDCGARWRSLLALRGPLVLATAGLAGARSSRFAVPVCAAGWTYRYPCWATAVARGCTPGGLPERPMGADCKSVAKATQVRILDPPQPRRTAPDLRLARSGVVPVWFPMRNAWSARVQGLCIAPHREPSPERH